MITKEYKIVEVSNKLSNIFKYLFYVILVMNLSFSIYFFIYDVSSYFGKSLIILITMGVIFAFIKRKNYLVKIVGYFRISKNQIITINIDEELFQKKDLKDYIVYIDGYTNQITFLWDSFLIRKGFENLISFTLTNNKHYKYSFIINDKEDLDFINECELIMK